MPAPPPNHWDFSLTYWGTTGSYPRPPSRETQKAQFINALLHLRDKNQLEALLDAVAAVKPSDSLSSLLAKVPDALLSSGVGNTTCIELQTQDSHLLFDAGSGLVEWGRQATQKSSAERASRREGHLLLSHVHLDHLCGLPFADPFYDATMSWTIWAPPDVLEQLREILAPPKSDNPSLIPVSLDQLVGIRELKPLRLDSVNHIGDAQVTVHPLRHPGGSYAYALTSGESKICLVTDHEHAEQSDLELAEFARAADLLYLDAQYTAAEYDGREGIDGGRACSRKGWGHSTVESSIATAVTAGVRQLHLGHHDPRRTPDSWKQLEELSKQVLQNMTPSSQATDLKVMFAREGDHVYIAPSQSR